MKKIATWLKNIAISIDQLGNAIAGGNPDVTISSRVGYFSNCEEANSDFYYYWKILEKIIDTTFYPLEGRNHCLNAYEETKLHVHGNDMARGLLGFFVIIGCIFVGLFTWTLYIFGYKPVVT